MIPKIALFTAVAAVGLFAQTPRNLYLEKIPDGKPVAHHLGLRYSVLLVDPQTRNAREIDPDRVLHEGDCIAFEFAPNHSGNLYVFNHGSSGSWQLLMPSPQMFNESGSVKSGEVKRLPEEHCFRLDNQPGVEKFVLAITERPDDMRQLRELLGNAPSLGELLNSWQKLTSRDLKFEKIAQPAAPGERPNSVYAVKTSAAESDRLVLEIQIHHE